MQIALLAVMLLVGVVPALAAPTEPESISQISLTEMLASRFDNLSFAEKRLAAASEIGETADCTDLSAGEKTIRGDLLAWLCTNPRASAQLTHRGISVNGARFINKLDLDWKKITFPVKLSDCEFQDGISLAHSQMLYLSLAKSNVREIDASKTHFEGDVDLNGIRVSNGITLTGSKIDGDLICDGGRFGNGEKLAIDLTDTEVKANVFLQKSVIEGGISLEYAKIDGNVQCTRSLFGGNEGAIALTASGVQVKGDVYFNDNFEANGGVDLGSATIDGNLDCSAGKFIGNNVAALVASGVQVKGDVYFNDNFEANGGVNLGSATIDGNLECDGGQFTSGDAGWALVAISAEIKGHVLLNNGFKADGGVNLKIAKIDENLECYRGTFIGNDNVPALLATAAKIGGYPLYFAIASVQWVRSTFSTLISAEV